MVHGSGHNRSVGNASNPPIDFTDKDIEDIVIMFCGTDAISTIFVLLRTTITKSLEIGALFLLTRLNTLKVGK